MKVGVQALAGLSNAAKRKLLLLMLLPWIGSIAHAAAPKLTHLFPAGAQRGTTVTVKCSGEFDWPLNVWSPGIEVELADEKGQLNVTVPENLAVDRVWIRFYNGEGISESVPFLIGALPDVSELEPNNTLSTAQQIEQNCTVNGKLHKRGELDGFSLMLKQGETLVAAVDANTRIASPMDAILQVVTPKGTVLLENHDDVGLDPRLAFTAPRDGNYIVRIFAFASQPNTSINYHGGDDYIYRLTLTTGPFISHANPMSVPQSGETTVSVLGWNIPEHMQLPVVHFGDGSHDHLREWEAWNDRRISASTELGIVFAQDVAGSARVRLLPFELKMVAPKHEDASHIKLQIPTAIVRCLDRDDQVDGYRIPLKMDQQIVLAVESIGLHLPMVPLVRLFDPEGKSVAEILENGPAKDAIINYKATVDGEYRLSISDRYRSGSSRHFYQLSVRIDESDFELAASADSIVTSIENPAELAISVNRINSTDGEIGEIKIEVIGLPDSATSAVVVSSPSDDTSKKVTVKIETRGESFSGPIQIQGTTEQPRSIMRMATVPPKQSTTGHDIWLTATKKKE